MSASIMVTAFWAKIILFWVRIPFLTNQGSFSLNRLVSMYSEKVSNFPLVLFSIRGIPNPSPFALCMLARMLPNFLVMPFLSISLGFIASESKGAFMYSKMRIETGKFLLEV